MAAGKQAQGNQLAESAHLVAECDVGLGLADAGYVQQKRVVGWTFDALFVVFGVLNFPALLVAAAILESLGEPAVWLRVLIGSLAVWSGDYLLVRLAEWRAWINIPVFLDLEDEDTRPTKSI